MRFLVTRLSACSINFLGSVIQILAYPSALAVATRVPSGLNAIAVTSPSSSRRRISAPVAESDTRALPLTPVPLAVIIRARSRLNGHCMYAAMVVEAEDLGTGSSVQYCRGAVVAGGGDTGAVEAERHGGHGAGMLDAGDLGAGGSIEYRLWPLNMAAYDRRPELTARELEALRRLGMKVRLGRCYEGNAREWQIIGRLLQPGGSCGPLSGARRRQRGHRASASAAWEVLSRRTDQ